MEQHHEAIDLFNKIKELRNEKFIQIHELMRLCHQLNMGTTYAAFIRDSGHVNKVDFSICYSKDDYENVLKEIRWLAYTNIEEKVVEEDLNWTLKALENDLKIIKEFRNFIEDLLINPTKEIFKVTYNSGITQVSKTFNTEEERQKWVDNAEKTIGKSVKGATPIYETLKENRSI